MFLKVCRSFAGEFVGGERYSHQFLGKLLLSDLLKIQVGLLILVWRLILNVHTLEMGYVGHRFV